MESIAERFGVALERAGGPGVAGPELPLRLVRACAEMLPADGAGLSVQDDAGRVPLGASSADAATAERLQFLAGSGPALTAHRHGNPVFAMADDLVRRWRPFADLLLGRTPYRGVVALPLPPSLAGALTLDLYFTDDLAVPRLPVFEAMAVGELITSALSDAALWSDWDPAHGRRGLGAPRHRAVAWEAVAEVRAVPRGDAGTATDVTSDAASA